MFDAGPASEQDQEFTAFGDMFALATTALAWAEDDVVHKFDDAEITTSYEQLRQLGDLFHAQAQRRLAIVDERQTFKADGYTSTTAYLKHRFRSTGGRAKRDVTNVRALQQMPQTRRLVELGRLSGDQTRVLIEAHQSAPESFPDAEEELCELAETLEWVADLRRTTAYWQQAAAPALATDTAEQQYDLSYLHVSRTFDGMVKLDGLYDRERGTQLISAINAATPPPIDGEPTLPSQRRAAALFDLVVSNGEKPSTPLLLVHVDADTLGGPDRSLAEVGNDVLDPFTIDRLSCDAQFRRIVFGPNSELIDIGRAMRLVTKPMRDAVIARDRHCAFPGCDRDAKWCDCHHLIPWSLGGETSTSNLILLCRHHHTLVHQAKFTLSGTGHEPRFYRANGQLLNPFEYHDTG